MIYDHERRVAVLSNGREYVPAVFSTPERTGAAEPCAQEWYCTRPSSHSGPCFYDAPEWP